MEQKNELKFNYQTGVIGKTPADGCVSFNDCWQGISMLNFPNTKTPPLYEPYIGEEYKNTRILFLGINFNGCKTNENVITKGAARYLAEIAHHQITKEKKIKTFAYKEDGKKYPGSFLWHRILSYTALYLRFKNKCLDDINLPKLPLKDELDVAFNHLAFTNIVKCCPNTKNCNPNEAMFNNCSKNYLIHEVNILKPNSIVIFGDQTFNSFRKIFPLSSDSLTASNDYVKLYNHNSENYQAKVFKFYHPGSPKGKGVNKKNYSELISILKSL